MPVIGKIYRYRYYNNCVSLQLPYLICSSRLSTPTIYSSLLSSLTILATYYYNNTIIQDGKIPYVRVLDEKVDKVGFVKFYPSKKYDEYRENDYQNINKSDLIFVYCY